MKLIFFMALLANIIFFLWEYPISRLSSVPPGNSSNEKKLAPILLLSEIAKQTEHSILPLEDDAVEVNAQLIVADIKLATGEAIAESAPSEVIDGQYQVIDTSREGLRRDELLAVDVDNAEATASIQSLVNAKVAENSSQTQLSDRLLPTGQSYCHQLGAVDDQNSLNQWRTVNESSTNSARQIEKSINKKLRYLVYYPPAESVEQSKDTIQSFKRMGVNELWLFRRGALKGAISFGLFSQEGRALSLQKHLSAKGIVAEILQSDTANPAVYVSISTAKEEMKNADPLRDKLLIAECEKQ